jgi:hypothetical protein
MRTSDEQRKHKRFVPEGLAFVVFRPEFSKIGAISDISRGGLGCSYLCPVDEGSPVAEMCQMVDILLSGDSFYSSKISCSPVYDDRENNGQESFMQDVVNRRCGLKFDQLTKEQEKQINFFLENHTVGTT